MSTEPHDLQTLKELVRAGATPTFVFFWSHAGTPGVAGKECLSQWYPAGFRLGGELFRTAEHYMMTQKARLFGDDQAAREILASLSPSDAKMLGRGIRGFDERRWLDHRLDIVVAGNRAKFTQNPQLGAFLRSTHGRVLVEASPKDPVWGIGLEERDPRAHDPLRWQGINLLGFALMVVRATLDEEVPDAANAQ